MRTFTIALVALLGLVASPSADAKKGKGKGKGGQDGAATVIAGAGQRLHFSFGGRLLLQDGNKLKGNFSIVSHPIAPNSTRLVVSCRYQEFKNVSLAGPRLEFEGKGNCGVLSLDGKLEKIAVKNKFVIVDVPDSADQIDVEIVGDTGIMVPGGNLDFGNFTFTTPS